MDNLLTIKEAALFLNVSEMSLRRWTNTGKLKCYRVGGKNERRFTRQELERFLRASKGRVPLGIGGATVEDCSHMVHFYKDADESVAEGIRYLECGLSRGESILIISTDDRLTRISTGLNDLGFPVENLKGDGLVVTDTGRFDVSEQIRFFASAMAKFPIDKGFRLLGDMTWAVEKGWSLDDISRLEDMANHFLTRRNRLILCQYDLAYFGADGAMMAFDAHNLTIYRGEVKESPYFMGSTVYKHDNPEGR
jgi:transcriptional repressor of dcmA and dcmR